MTAEALRAGYPFPYLYDEEQSVAKAFRAACTPEFYLFGRNGKTRVPRPVRREHPRGMGLWSRAGEAQAALDALLAGKPVNADQKPSIGCSIKWKRRERPRLLVIELRGVLESRVRNFARNYRRRGRIEEACSLDAMHTLY